jgi:hypothetical protein
MDGSSIAGIPQLLINCFNKNNFGAKIDGSQENIYQGTPDYTRDKS